MSNKKPTTLNWDDFRALGNPENAPEEPVEKAIENPSHNSKFIVRIYKEKKKRGGKAVSVIKGIELNDDAMKALCKQIKTKCGVGGNVKDGEIIIQGTNRDQIKSILLSEGYSNTKLAGA